MRSKQYFTSIKNNPHEISTDPKNCLNGEEYPFVTLKIDATRYCGMGMYFPGRQIKSSWDKYCQSSVAWYNAAGWNEIQP